MSLPAPCGHDDVFSPPCLQAISAAFNRHFHGLSSAAPRELLRRPAPELFEVPGTVLVSVPLACRLRGPALTEISLKFGATPGLVVMKY
eukprot:COSAG01_NODE_5788_length_4034_cov_1.990597_6_plen_89_part_00